MCNINNNISRFYSNINKTYKLKCLKDFKNLESCFTENFSASTTKIIDKNKTIIIKIILFHKCIFNSKSNLLLLLLLLLILLVLHLLQLYFYFNLNLCYSYYNYSYYNYYYFNHCYSYHGSYHYTTATTATST